MLEKRQLIQTFQLDITSRDMRILDSQFSNYDTIGQISVRDQTIVFGMEHVKLVIRADKVRASWNALPSPSHLPIGSEPSQ